MSTELATDTVIIGAGAAGLAAASELTSNGRHVLLLEARERLGGRILTERSTFGAVPIELGAEFIHGQSSVLLGLLKSSNDIAIDASRTRWTVKRGKLRRADAQSRNLHRAFGRLSVPARDMSFAEFLQRHRSLSPEVRRLARSLVEGFDAADMSRISAGAVLDEWSGPAAADAPTFRPSRGYGALIQTLHEALPANRATLELGTVVRAVDWSNGRVTVEAHRRGETVRIQAARAIVTLPLGVLQIPSSASNSVQFTPGLRDKSTALQGLATGPAIKVVMSIARPFWEELHDTRYRDAAFFFAPNAAFPTFWTMLPLRTSMLVAWCAGPKASSLAGKGKDEVVAAVIQSLRAMFGRRNYASLLDSVHWHDWQGDPFANGAYSYIAVGGARARRALAEPVADTLYFAGEACDFTGEAATVGGALLSGIRAARQILQTLRRCDERRGPRRTAAPPSY